MLYSMLRGFKATAAAGNGMIAAFFGFGALCLFSGLILVFLALAALIGITVIVLAVIDGRRIKRERQAIQAEINAHAQRRSQAYYSNRR